MCVGWDKCGVQMKHKLFSRISIKCLDIFGILSKNACRMGVLGRSLQSQTKSCFETHDRQENVPEKQVRRQSKSVKRRRFFSLRFQATFYGFSNEKMHLLAVSTHSMCTIINRFSCCSLPSVWSFYFSLISCKQRQSLGKVCIEFFSVIFLWCVFDFYDFDIQSKQNCL